MIGAMYSIPASAFRAYGGHLADKFGARRRGLLFDEEHGLTRGRHTPSRLQAADRCRRGSAGGRDTFLSRWWGGGTWPAVHAQFGAGFKAIEHFKRSLLETPGAATPACPEARVELDEAGIALHAGRPPVARLAAVG
jgi:hypothetical protein